MGSRVDLQEHHRIEAQQRYQQVDESVRIYMTCLESILLKLEPRPTTQKIVEAVHDMLPELKRLVRREDCRSVIELIKRVFKAELALEREAGDRMPIHPRSSVIPNATYQPSGNSGRKPRGKVTPTPTVAALEHEGAQCESKEIKKGMVVLQELTRVVQSLTHQLLDMKEQSARQS